MAIRLVTGTPGGGKSFYCVKHLVENYYVRIGGLYEPKKGVTVLSNLDGFKLEHLNLDEVIKKSGKGVEGFFTVDYQKKVLEKHGQLVYIIDECQRYFDEYFRNKDVIYFFEYHRHLGVDVYLCSQSPNRICRAIRDLAEVEIRAVRRVLSFVGELKYNVLAGGEIIQKKAFRRDPEIFRLYKSFEAVEREKIKNPLVKWFGVAAGVGVLGVLLFYFTFMGGPSRSSKAFAASAPSSLPTAGGGVGSSGSAPLPSPPPERLLCSVDFAAVGDDILVYSALRNDLVPVDVYSKDAVIKKRGGYVVGVYCYLSGDELDAYRAARLPSPPGEGEGGRRKAAVSGGVGQGRGLTGPGAVDKQVNPVKGTRAGL